MKFSHLDKKSAIILLVVLGITVVGVISGLIIG